MLHPIQSRALLLLTFLGGLGAGPASGCGLDHCPRPKVVLLQERPSVSWGLEHSRLDRGGFRSRYTQGSFHLRVPAGSRWILGGHLPFGYLQTGAEKDWGLANPMAYAERSLRLGSAQAMTLGLQLELPFGDDASGIASAHAMAMPYLSYALRGSRALVQASLGVAAQLSGSHSHGDSPAAAEDHSLHQGAAAPLTGPGRVEVNPHEPYELLYRFSLALPLQSLRLEPEISLAGARVLFPEAGAAADFVSTEAAVGLRISRELVLKPRWEQQLTHPARFAWSTGLDVKFDVPVF